MLPVVAGRVATTRQILAYGAALVLVSMLPWALGFAGILYGVTALISGTILFALAYQLIRSREADRRAAHRLFAFSISYLFVLFAALLVEHASQTRGSAQTELLASPVRAAVNVTPARADEV
jgi:protoheme IX farnesyltransferase